MTQFVTLQVSVDPSGTVAGTGVVTNSIQRMTQTSNSQLASLSKSFNNLEKMIDRTASRMKQFLVVFGVAHFGKELLDRMIEINQNFIQFTATLEAVKGSSQAAQAEFQYLLDASNKLGQNVESNTKNYMRLAASMKHVDSTGESTRHVFEGVATAASVLHLKGYEANGILIAFEQILSKNKVSLEEVQRQLSNRMPDAMGTAARAMNMSQEEFRKGITDGTIPALEFVIRMANQMKIEYGDAAKKTADSFQGMKNRMENAFFELGRSIGQAGAMEGLTRILREMTTLLSNPEVGVALGQSLGEFFGMIADWISKLTASDINDFFLGLGVVVGGVTDIFKELVGTFDDTLGAQPTFIDFCESLANGLLNVAETVRTMISGMLLIPQTVGYVYNKVRLLGRELNPKSWMTGAHSDHNLETQELETTIQNQIKSIQTSAKNFFATGGDSGNKARINIRERGREARNKSIMFKNTPLVPRAIDPNIGQPLSEDKITKLASEAPKPKGKTKKQGGRTSEDVFNTESVALAKSAALSLLEYNNILNDTLAIESKNLTQLEIKFRYDKNFIKLSSEKKEVLRGLAKEADLAAAKEKAAQAFQNDRLSLNKTLYQSEQQMTDIMEYQNDAAMKHQRELEEKLKFDVAYRAMTDDMIKQLRELAKANDEAAIKTANLKAVESSRYQTRLSEVSLERDLANMRKGLSPSKYTERDKAVDSMRKGGENFNLDPDTKLKMLDDAGKRDRDTMTRDAEAFALQLRENIKVQQEERDMIGQSTWAIQKYTETKKIDDFFKQQGIDLTDESNALLLEFSRILKGEVISSIDAAQEKTQDWLSGLKSGLQTYLDEINNVQKSMENMTVRVFKKMEDSIVDFVMTGKFNFRDFATMIISELVRIMVQMLIMKPIMNALMSSGMFGFADGGAFEGGKQTYAKGGMFPKRFAAGGVVDSPTNFMMGQMGERGPEAIMPLTRDAQGRLGVRSAGGDGSGVGSINITVTVINGQQGSEVKAGSDNEQGAQLADRVKAAALQVIHEELRPGGVLAGARR